MIAALLHRLRGHDVSHLAKIEPTRITRSGIRVFEQNSFRPPMAHYYCNTCETALL